MNFMVKLLENKDLNKNLIINIIIVVNKLFKQVHYESIIKITILNTVRAFYQSI